MRAVVVDGAYAEFLLVPAPPGGDEGADVAIEAAGTPDAWEQAPRLVRRGGRSSSSAAFGPAQSPRSTRTASTTRTLTLRGAFHHAARHVRAVLAFLASGAYPWERLVTPPRRPRLRPELRPLP